MKRIALLVALVSLCTLTACPPPAPGTPTSSLTTAQQLEQEAAKWATTCALPALGKLVLQILPEVILDLNSMNFSNLLTQLEATLTQQGIPDGLTAITCAIANMGANAATAPKGASTLPTIYSHGLTWLLAHAPHTLDGGVK